MISQKGESTKCFAPFDFLGAPDPAQNPPYCGSQNTKAKSHKPRLELGFTGGIGGQLQQLVGGLSITQEEHVGRNSCRLGRHRRVERGRRRRGC